jgi:hypothetical protein
MGIPIRGGILLIHPDSIVKKSNVLESEVIVGNLAIPLLAGFAFFWGWKRFYRRSFLCTLVLSTVLFFVFINVL